MTKIALVEKFYSIQGEGANAGRAAIFIRFSGCNLSCIFADGARCDTPWRTVAEKLSVDAIAAWVETQIVQHCGENWRDVSDRTILPMVILTGGEPTASPGFRELVNVLRWNLHLYVAVESNGTRWDHALHSVDWLVISPKNNIAHARPVNAGLDPWALDTAHEIRNVIGSGEVAVPPFYAGKYNCVSPAMLTEGDGSRFAPGALERCIEIVRDNPGFRLSLQVHKWTNIR